MLGFQQFERVISHEDLKVLFIYGGDSNKVMVLGVGNVPYSYITNLFFSIIHKSALLGNWV